MSDAIERARKILNTSDMRNAARRRRVGLDALDLAEALAGPRYTCIKCGSFEGCQCVNNYQHVDRHAVAWKKFKEAVRVT